VTGSSGGYPGIMARTLELISAGAIEPASISRGSAIWNMLDLLEMVKAKTIDGKAVCIPPARSRYPECVHWTAEAERAYLAGSGAQRELNGDRTFVRFRIGPYRPGFSL